MLEIDMGAGHLHLVVSNPALSGNPPPSRPSVRTLHLVPESDTGIKRTVRRFSDFLLSDDVLEPARYLKARRRFDTSEVAGSIFCLCPAAADSLQAELKIIAELSLHPALRRAAIMKLAEAELP